MSIYQRFTNTDEGNELVIEHNLSAYDDEGRSVGLYVHGGSEFGTYSVDDIPRMIETLQAIYDDFEANKPKEPTLDEFLGPLPVGAIIRFGGESTTWVKMESNKWESTINRIRLDLGNPFISSWNPTVIYNPKEAN